MHFESFADFLAMGGHALYVWLAYGVTVVALAGNFLFVRSALKAEQRQLKWHSVDPGSTSDE